jgi:thioredoxin 1
MENYNEKKSSRRTAPKIIIPILIIVVIAGIWLLKNLGAQEAPSEDIDNPDFELHVTEEIDLEHLKSYGLPIMIDFGADSCAPCRAMAPILEKLNKQLQGKAIIKYVDVGKYAELTRDYPMTGVIPVQVFFDKDGKAYTPSDPQGMSMNMYSLKETNEHVFTVHEGSMTEEMILAVLNEMGMEK